MMPFLDRPLHHPKIVVKDTVQQLAQHVAGIFAEAITDNPSIVLGLATGQSPVGTYQELVDWHRRRGLDFSRVTSFNLDEYVGLAADHPQSFRYFMQQQLFDPTNIDPDRTHVPDGTHDDLSEHARQYERAIERAGGIDLQLLGIGTNGHIGFNEPGSPPESRTRVISLSEQTIAANAPYFPSIHQVPRRAITMGIGTILEARQIVMIALGSNKAAAVAEAVAGPVSPSCPASCLRTHANVTVVLDHEAAAGL